MSLGERKEFSQLTIRNKTEGGYLVKRNKFIHWREVSIKMTRPLPADDSLSAKHAIGYSPSQLPVDLECHPHRRVDPCQAEGRVSFPVHDVNVCTSGQEQPAETRDACVWRYVVERTRRTHATRSWNRGRGSRLTSTHVTHSRKPSLAAMWSGVSPCMLTEAREQPEFNTSSAISTLPAYAAQWRHTFSSWREGWDCLK